MKTRTATGKRSRLAGAAAGTRAALARAIAVRPTGLSYLLQLASRMFLVLATTVLLARPPSLGISSLPTAPSPFTPAVIFSEDRLAASGDLSAGVRVQYDNGEGFVVWAVTPLSARWPQLQSAPPLSEQMRRVRAIQQGARGPPLFTPLRNGLRLRPL